MWLVNSSDPVDEVITFLQRTNVGLPCLLDRSSGLYSSYDRRSTEGSYAPYPFQVLIDQNGVIRYIATQYDPAGMRDRIDELLAD